MKRLSFFALIEIVLGAAAAIMLAIFLALVIGNAARQKAAEGELLAAIDNAEAVCDNFDKRIEIDEDIRPYVDIYKNDIETSDSTIKKAYYANILITYVQNRVNMNNPKTLLSMAKELGTAYETNSSDIAKYEGYAEDIAEAFDRLKKADKAFKSYAGEEAGSGITEIYE